MDVGWLGLALAAALGWAVGCGGTVVVDHEGASGSGGATSTGPGDPTTTGPGGDPPDTCDSICAFSDQLGCGAGSNCLPDCHDFYEMSSGCTAELDAYFSCVLTYATSCEFDEPECNSLLAAYNKCMGGSTCGPTSCFYDPSGSCGCEGLCNGLDVSVQCGLGPSGQFDCSCQVGNTIVAICQEDAATCDLLDGCCAPYLYGF